MKFNTKWDSKNLKSLSGKRVVLTGATGGLGEKLSMKLVDLGAELIMVCRSESKANALVQKIKSVKPEAKIKIVYGDFGSRESVDHIISEIKMLDGIDILINNAGVYNVPVKTLDSGFNNIFQINFLYTYYLTQRLLPELEKREGSRCITLGSIAYNYSNIDELDIDFSKKEKPRLIYGNSKRFLMGSMYELFKNKKVGLAVVHPGVTLTNMTNHYPKAINWLVKIGIKLFFPSPKKAIRSILLGTKISTPYLHWIGPKTLNVWGNPKLKRVKSLTEAECKMFKNLAENELG